LYFFKKCDDFLRSAADVEEFFGGDFVRGAAFADFCEAVFVNKVEMSELVLIKVVVVEEDYVDVKFFRAFVFDGRPKLVTRADDARDEYDGVCHGEHRYCAG